MSDGRNVVWVLGAGFSRPLGAPLLNDLMGEHRLRQMHASYPKAEYDCLRGPYIDTVCPLFAEGKRRGLWGDPEQFLDYLDTGANAEGAASELVAELARTLGIVEADQLPRMAVAAKTHAAARRMMAAECMAFLEGQDTKTETWQPYWDWLRLVGSQDVIITFNYDRVVERLLEDSPQRIYMPRVAAPNKSDPPRDCAAVLKLHGSVDWKRTQAGYEPTRDAKFALTCSDDELGIASPGSNKLKESQGGLKNLWDWAGAALEHADTVVFLGYRFPPSDAYARKHLLSALFAGTSHKIKTAHVVLGPNSKDAARTTHLLHYAFQRSGRTQGPAKNGGAYNVVEQPLYVEDFLTLVSREQLLQTDGA